MRRLHGNALAASILIALAISSIIRRLTIRRFTTRETEFADTPILFAIERMETPCFMSATLISSGVILDLLVLIDWFRWADATTSNMVSQPKYLYYANFLAAPELFVDPAVNPNSPLMAGEGALSTEFGMGHQDRHSGESRNPVSLKVLGFQMVENHWIPAFAGMTIFRARRN